MSEHLARKFHEIYERLAPIFGYETREETREFDETSKNGQLMIAVCDQIQTMHDAANQSENASLRAALAKSKKMMLDFRDAVLHQRGALAENGMTSEQVNDVLAEFDAALDAEEGEE
jgi:hypothetical protein